MELCVDIVRSVSHRTRKFVLVHFIHSGFHSIIRRKRRIVINFLHSLFSKNTKVFARVFVEKLRPNTQGLKFHRL